jgi:hypothetical protein
VLAPHVADNFGANSMGAVWTLPTPQQVPSLPPGPGRPWIQLSLCCVNALATRNDVFRIQGSSAQWARWCCVGEQRIEPLIISSVAELAQATEVPLLGCRLIAKAFNN